MREKEQKQVELEKPTQLGLKLTCESSCGNPIQTMEHILENCELGPKITDTDLSECTDAALDWIQSWRWRDMIC